MGALSVNAGVALLGDQLPGDFAIVVHIGGDFCLPQDDTGWPAGSTRIEGVASNVSVSLSC